MQRLNQDTPTSKDKCATYGFVQLCSPRDAKAGFDATKALSISVGMNKMVTALPGFQRFSFCEVLLKVLVTLILKVGGDGDGVVDREGYEAVKGHTCSLDCSTSPGGLVPD